MRGYIAVTDPEWHRFNRLNNNLEVIFWRKCDRPVGIEPDDILFFLIRGKVPRSVLGYGTARKIAVDTIENIWNQYRKETGCNDIESFEFKLEMIRTKAIAYYLLHNVNYINPEFVVTDTDLDFAKNTVSGKFISEEKANLLVKFLSTGGRSIIKDYRYA